MKRYIALLRGINISGKNKISMAELKNGFEGLSFENVRTYLNSGNVVFSSGEDDTEKILYAIEEMIKSQFDLEIPVYVITKDDIMDILQNAPEWWGGENKEIYHNLIFIMPPKTAFDVYNELGEPQKDLERIQSYKQVIFWSFSRKEYQKTKWWSKTATAAISSKLTIRTANTIRKIAN